MTLEKIIKSILIVGLEAFSPIVGTIVTSAIMEGATLLLDYTSEKRAEDLENLYVRLFEQMYAQAKQIDYRGEGLATIATTAEVIIKTSGLRRDEWLLTNLDGLRAAKLIFERSGQILSTLSPTERDVCHSLLESFYIAMFAEREILKACEIDFRRETLNRIDNLPEEVRHRLAEDSERLLSLTADALVEIPLIHWDAERYSPGFLLRADCDQSVPFHKREKEIADLEAWCQAEQQVGTRLYIGPGGIGIEWYSADAKPGRLRGSSI